MCAWKWWRKRAMKIRKSNQRSEAINTFVTYEMATTPVGVDICYVNWTTKVQLWRVQQDKQISSVDTLIIWFTSFKIIIINYMSLCVIFTAFAIMFITMVFSWKIDDRLIMHECLRIQLIDLFKRWRLYLRRETVFERGFIITLDHFSWKSLKKTSFSTPIMFAV